MFVCHGNICRSPMAEFILKDMDTDTKTRSIIYEQTLVDDDSTEYSDLKTYYANNS